MKLRILPYKGYSVSAKALVNSLRPMAIIKKQTTRLKGRRKVLLNWGHSAPQFDMTGATVLNPPRAVANASNKLVALQAMQAAGVKIPEFTTDPAVARAWTNEKRIVFCRTMLRANSGRGIIVANKANEVVAAPLYTKYIRKEKEYRLHVFNGQVIDAVEKKRKQGFKENNDYNRYVRSYEQGWIFTRDGINITQATKDEAVKACRALGLDFGAVDIVMDRKNAPVVLEINTAPGLQGTTLQSYKKAVSEWFRSLR